jgi:acyl-CoA synthetase (NDP forming)
MGLEVVQLSDKTIEKLRERLPSWWAPNNPVDLVAGLGYADAIDLIPILMESGEVDGVFSLGMGWIYGILDPVNAERGLQSADNQTIRMLVEREIENGKRMAEFSRRWGKPLFITSNAARLAVRRGYQGLLQMLDRKVMVYPSVHDAIRVYGALADRRDFLEQHRTLDGLEST